MAGHLVQHLLRVGRLDARLAIHEGHLGVVSVALRTEATVEEVAQILGGLVQQADLGADATGEAVEPELELPLGVLSAGAFQRDPGLVALSRELGQ